MDKLLTFRTLKKLAYVSVTLVLALDNDKAGEKATEKLAEELRQRNISFYRADGFYGDFKGANEVLVHSRWGG